MRPMKTADNIVSVSEFKTHASQMLRSLSENDSPVVITQNGRAAGVVLSPKAYDELTAHFRFLATIEESDEDVQRGRVSSHDEVKTAMVEKLNALKEAEEQ